MIHEIKFADWPTGPMTANPRVHDLVINEDGCGTIDGIDSMNDLIQLCRDLGEPIVVYPDGVLLVKNGYIE